MATPDVASDGEENTAANRSVLPSTLESSTAVQETRLPDPSDRLLCCLSSDSCIRRAASACYLHPAFGNAVLLFILLNSLQMLLVAARVPVFVDAEYTCDVMFTAFFTLEMVIKILALGFVGHKRAYLRSSWNVFDFIVVIVSLVSLAGVGSNVSVIRLLRVLRPLRSMSRVEGMRSLMNALFASVPKIIDNVLLMIFLIVTFAILGLQIFNGVLHRRCYIVNVDNTSYSAILEAENRTLPVLLDTETRSCGGAVSCTDRSNLGELQPEQVVCRSDTPRFQELPLNFDNMFRAVLLVFKVISGDDWPDDMHRLMNSLSGWACLFFIVVVIFGSFFATNLFLAVLIDAYYEQRKTAAAESNAKRARDHVRDMLEETGAGSKWNQLRELGNAGVLALFSKDSAKSLRSQRRSSATDGKGTGMMKLLNVVSSVVRRDRIEKEEKEAEPGAFAKVEACMEPCMTFIQPSRHLVERVVDDRIVQWGMLAATVLNVLVLAVDHYRINSTLEKALSIVNISCTCIFALEILLKFYARGIWKTLTDPYDCFDFVLVVLAVPDLVSGSSSAFTALRAFRILRAVRLVRRMPRLANLFKLVARSISGGFYVGLVMLLQIFIFSILGMQMFENKYPEDSRLRFDSLWEATVTCFVVITGESWATVMSEGMLGTNSAACLYFLVLFVTGNFVLVNVFTAIILDNMQDSINDDSQSQASQEFMDSVTANPLNPLDLTALRMLSGHGKDWKGSRRASTRSVGSASAGSPHSPAESPHGDAMNGALSPPGTIGRAQTDIMDGNQNAEQTCTTPPQLKSVPGVQASGAPREGVFASPRAAHQPDLVSEGDSVSSATTDTSKLGRALSSRNLVANRARIARRRLKLKEEMEAKQRKAAQEPFVIKIPRQGCRKSLGIVLERDRARNLLVIRAVHPGPAFDAGVEAGMVLLDVNGAETDAAQDQPAQLLRSMEQEAVEVALRVRREERFTLLQWRNANASRKRKEAAAVWCSFPPAPPLKGKALGLLGPDHPLRVFLARIVCSPQFDYAIAFVIAINVVFLALEHPGAGGNLRAVLDVSETVFTVVFVLEMAMKVLATGLWQDEPPLEIECQRIGCLSASIGAEVLGGVVTSVVEGGPAQEAGVTEGWVLRAVDGVPVAGDDPLIGTRPFDPELETTLTASFTFPDTPPPYLRDSFNQIDAVVVVASAATYAVKELRPFRALRTLRLLVRAQSIAVVLEALLNCLPAVTQGVVLNGFLYFVFGILGVQLFKGKLYECTDASVRFEKDCFGNFTTDVPAPVGTVPGLPQERYWRRKDSHFDHILASILTLFEVATGEGWAAIMYDVVDATNPGEGPRRNANPSVTIFFVVFFMLANFFAMQLIVGLIIQHFLKEREELDSSVGGVFLTTEQLNYVQAEQVLRRVMFKKDREPPQNRVRLAIHNLVVHPMFDNGIFTAIVLNMLVLASLHENQTEAWDNLQWGSSWAFIGLFTAEAALKLTGLGIQAYFADAWNKFDFCVVCGGLVGQFVSSVKGLSSLRALRVGRLFRLVGKAKGLQELFNTIFRDENFFFFLNVSTFLLAIFFIFAVAGVDLFGSIEHSRGIDQNTNFETLPNALLTLFTLSTTETWLDVRHGATSTDGECGVPGKGDCGERWKIVYFLAFIVVGSFVLLNVFSAVVVELYQKEDKMEELKPILDSFSELRDRWSEHFGPQTTIHASQFLRAVQSPDPKESKQPQRSRSVVERFSVFGQSIRDTISPGAKSRPVDRPRGLLPPKLRRVDMGPGHTMRWLQLPRYEKPSPRQLLGFMSACSIPLARGGFVEYRDVVYCLAAKAFGVDAKGVQMLADVFRRTQTVSPAQNEFLIVHYYACQRICEHLQNSKAHRLKEEATEERFCQARTSTRNSRRKMCRLHIGERQSTDTGTLENGEGAAEGKYRTELTGRGSDAGDSFGERAASEPPPGRRRRRRSHKVERTASDPDGRGPAPNGDDPGAETQTVEPPQLTTPSNSRLDVRGQPSEASGRSGSTGTEGSAQRGPS